MRYAIYLLLLLSGPAFSGEPDYTWRSTANDPDRIYLYRDGKQIGGWCYRAKHYRPLDGETWGPPSEASPVQPPERRWAAVTISRQSPSPPRRRGLRGRIDAAMDQVVAAEAARAAPWVAQVIDEALKDALKSIPNSLYEFDLAYSAKLLAHIEMGGKLNDKMDSDDYRAAKELITKGSASVFLSERAKFAEKLREEKFSNPVLAKIYFDIEDEPQASKLIGLHQSRLLFNAGDWREDPKTVAADTPAVLMFINHKDKDAKEKIPVTVHCSFVFTALKEGKSFEKTLSFDLYLETLESQKGEPLSYPWKVRNVQYK